MSKQSRGIVENAIESAREARIASLNGGPERAPTSGERAVPVTWEDVFLVRSASGLRAADGAVSIGDMLRALADRLEAWLKEQERKAA